MKSIPVFLFALILLVVAGCTSNPPPAEPMRNNGAVTFALFMDKDAECVHGATTLYASAITKDTPPDTALCKLNGQRWFCTWPFDGRSPGCSPYASKEDPRKVEIPAEKPASLPNGK